MYLTVYWIEPIVVPVISNSLLFFLVRKKMVEAKTKTREINIRRIKIIKLAVVV
tara:strand:- start:380 stop:541 length:162 start_codon:yes stop_codon:yes gene_type:complete